MPTNPFAPGRRDRRAADLDRKLGSDLPLSPSGTRSGADPAGAQGRARAVFAGDLLPVVGRVVDAVAYTHFYKVQLASGLGTVRCCAGVHSGLRATGPRQLSSYGPGDAVLVLYDRKGLYSYIVCGVPDWVFDARAGVGDAVAQGSAVGLQADAAHQYPFLTTGGGGVIDFSAGRPADSLPGQEWGAITELGLRLLVDPFMVQAAADEETGLFVFYHDQLTRLAGHNLQVRSAGHDREDLDDESEFSSVQGWTPYPWEALGALAPATNPAVELDADTVQQGSRFRSRLEPVHDDQLPVHRDVEFRGYLGQGGKKVVLAPTAEGLSRYADENTLVGLADLNTGLDGSVFNRSAHSVVIAKTPYPAVPKRKARPESRAGDRTDDAYKSCGLFGAGPAHYVQGQPTNPNDAPHVVEAATVLDQLTYAFNWKGLHPFHYHNLDWYLPDETDTAAYGLAAPEAIPFDDLETTHWLPQAPAYEVHVDDRYGLVKYYANVAAISLLPNGGVSIVDGWGAELRLAGGHMERHVPGDLIDTCGRNASVRAGRNVCVEGYDGAEVVAAKGDVRVKADRKVMVSGGNGGCGGVLVESRASATSFVKGSGPTEDVLGGIVLKADHAACAVLAKDLLLDATAGSIVGKAYDHVAFDSKQFRRHVSECAIDFFGTTSVNEYWPTQSRIGGDLFVGGTGYLGGDLVAVGMGVFGPSVRALTVGRPAATDATLFATVTSNLTRSLSAARPTSAAEITWIVDHSDVEELDFYFRPSAACLAADFALVEPVWQQLARQSGQTLPVWEEPVVTSANHGDTVPYPGHDAWVTNDGFGQQDFKFFDPEDSAAAARGSLYETAELAATAWVPLEGNWPVIKDVT